MLLVCSSRLVLLQLRLESAKLLSIGMEVQGVYWRL